MKVEFIMACEGPASGHSLQQLWPETWEMLEDLG